MGPFDRFNDRAKRVLALSQDEAIRFNHNYIGPEHLLLGLVREGGGAAARILDSLHVQLSTLRKKVEEKVGRGDSTTSPREIILSPAVKKIIDDAVEASRSMGHSHVGTEHLLVGIAHQSESIPAAILKELGITLDQVRERALQELGHPTASPPESGPGGPRGDLLGRFSDRGKRVLALAQDEATRLKHNYIGTEHLLLGLLRDEGLAARVLESLGVGLDKSRTAVEYIIGAGTETTAPSDITLSPRTKKVIEFAMDEARLLGHRQAGPEHILLGVVREGQGIASGVIESAGVSLTKVRERVIAAMGRPETDR